MAYGMEQLRKAGKALQNFDDAYSEKILDMYDNNLSDTGVQGAVKSAGMMFGGAVPSTRKFTDINVGGDNQRLEQALQVGLPAVSAMSKYGMPAVGVTLAGQGIIDLTAAFGTAADQPEPNSLGM